MAHNLMKDRMAFVGDEPWHRLGTKVDKAVSSHEMLRMARLDWLVRKVPAPGARPIRQRPGSTEIEYERYFLQRDAVAGEEVGPALGLVSHGYEVLQNEEAFQFFEPLIEAGGCNYETAGALGNGERVWVQVRMKNAIEVAKDDNVDRFFLLSNSHDGRGALSMRFTPIRVVCQNTLNLASKGGEDVVKVRHSKNMRERMTEEQARLLLKLIAETFDQAARQFRAMAEKRIDTAQRRAFLDGLFPRSDNQKSKGEVPLRWEMVEEARLKDKISPEETRDTVWGLYNAITHVEDHRYTTEGKTDAGADDARLSRVWFGSSADLKVKALARAVALCA